MGIPSDDLNDLQSYLTNPLIIMEATFYAVADREMLTNWLVLRDLFLLISSAKAKTIGSANLKVLMDKISNNHFEDIPEQLRTTLYLLLETKL